MKNIIKILLIISAIGSFALVGSACGSADKMLNDATSFISNDVSRASDVVNNENSQLADRENEQSSILDGNE